MASKFNIIIVGAGIAGLGAAIALADKGHKVTVLERHGQLQTLGSVIGIMPSGTRVLEQYGVLDDVFKICGDRSMTMIYRRWQDGSVLLSQTPSTRENLWGIRGASGKRGDFQHILYEAAKKRDVMVRFNCQVADVDDKGPSVTLSSGEKIEADLIVAADGINSAIKRVFYPDKRQLFSGIDDYMISVPTTKIRRNPKLAPLLDVANSWWGPTGCVIAGVAGIGEDVEYCMEFCIMSDEAGSEGNLVTITNIDKIKGAFKDWDPALIELLSFAEQARTWRLAYTTPDLDWVSKSGRTVLIGDAAHAMLPHAMAGATTALEDGASLAECLARAGHKSEIPKFLQAFETIRKPRLTYIQNEALGRAKMFHLPDGPAQKARDKMFAANPTMVPPSWDGKHIDNPPDETRRDLGVAYVVGHRVVDLTNRKLDEIYGVALKE
ncbi:FAD/NAD(P)-binding domain containing protein [Hyaloscypha variabilis]|uniref:FAD/NAD(P)-binding domain-containing protein n=1 Tax=Hyaloscypha variabilis (strain UAMH 11265 / GT02V1 / F) TaxID=1149755 RepID=A0A2J6QS11_HYAVF|nr:FAD/NAD(P)-binding domain-containing protein [Hyaloscypha variabilis F]